MSRLTQTRDRTHRVPTTNPPRTSRIRRLQRARARQVARVLLPLLRRPGRFLAGEVEAEGVEGAVVTNENDEAKATDLRRRIGLRKESQNA